MLNRISLLAAFLLLGIISATCLAGAPGGGAGGPPGAGGAPGGPGGAGGPGGGRGGGRGGAAGGAPAGLGAAMRDMNTALPKIQAEYTDAAKLEATLTDIATMQRDIAIAKLQTPPTIGRIADAAEKAKAMAHFRDQCNSLTRGLLELEDAVNAKKNDDAKKAIAKLIDIANAAHKEYNVNGKVGASPNVASAFSR